MDALSEISDKVDVGNVTVAPNGVTEGRKGKIVLYDTGSGFETWQNTDGSKTWVQIDPAGFADFKTGDWIISSVTTARTGWTNVSATYADKFMRINATPLTTGGSDTHDHSAATGSHTLSTSEIPAHTHAIKFFDTGGGAGHQTLNQNATSDDHVTESTGGGGGHTHTISSDNNIPAFVQVALFEKD